MKAKHISNKELPLLEEEIMEADNERYEAEQGTIFEWMPCDDDEDYSYGDYLLWEQNLEKELSGGWDN